MHPILTSEFLKPVTIIEVPQVKSLAVSVNLTLDTKQVTIDNFTKEVTLEICKP